MIYFTSKGFFRFRTFAQLQGKLIIACFHVAPSRYGKIREIDLKTPARPPAFAFIAFDDYRDAQDAIRGRDGYNFDGYRLRCEFAKGDRGGTDQPYVLNVNLIL